MPISKRILDLCIAGFVLLVLLPFLVLLIAALLILEGRPVFYISERMRSPTQSFALIKLRTMGQGAGDGGVTGAVIFRWSAPARRCAFMSMPSLICMRRFCKTAPVSPVWRRSGFMLTRKSCWLLAYQPPKPTLCTAAAASRAKPV